MTETIREIFKYANFLKELIKRDFKKKYYKSILGVLWTLLNPLFMMLIMTFVFSTLFKRNIEHYPIYYLSGWLVFNFTTEATTQGLHSVVSNSGLIKKIRIPSYLFCLSNVTLSMINKLLAMIPLFAIMIFLRVPFRWTLALMPVLLIPLFFFALGLALALAAMAVYFRDLFHLYGIVERAWLYLTPIFYPIDIIPERFLILWNYNPLFHYVNIIRGLVLYGTLPSLNTLLYAFSYATLAMGLGIALYSTLEKNFLLHI